MLIDVSELCRARSVLEGVCESEEIARRFPRLRQEIIALLEPLRWRVAGAQTQHGHALLHVTLHTRAQMLCQRCLTPCEIPLRTQAYIVAAASEQEADAFAQNPEYGAYEIIVGAPSCDLDAVLEDEALLALPQAPKHAACPIPAAASAPSAQADRIFPFADLKKRMENK